jgi:spermidine/putrescine transport system substrate-binding protein
MSDGKVYGIPVANGPYGLAYNTEKFEEAPKSWDIFWDPAHKKKYTVGSHEYLYNVGITALAMGYPRDCLSKYDKLNNPEFKNRLKQLAANAKSMWIGVDKPDDLFGLDMASSWGDSLSALKRRGEIWKMAEPKEGTLWWIDEYAMTWALSDKPFKKKLAEEWINQSLTTDFQVRHLVREVGIYPVISNIADLLTEEEKKKIKPGSKPGSFTKTRILQNVHSQRNRNGLKALWEAAKKGISVK